MLVHWLQRGWLAVAILLGGLAGAWAGRLVTAGSLAETVIPLASVHLFYAMGVWVAVMGVALVLAATYRLLGSGPAACFVLSAALIGGAVAGGPMDSFLAAVAGAGGYLPLAVEILLMTLLLVGGWVVLDRLPTGRNAGGGQGPATEEPDGASGDDPGGLPGQAMKVVLLAVIGTLLVALLLGADAAAGLAWALGIGVPALAAGVAVVVRLEVPGDGPGGAARGDGDSGWIRRFDPETWAMALVRSAAVMVVGAVVAVILLRSVESGQLVGGLMLAFGAAAAGADALFPGRARLPLLLAPLALGLGAYVSIWLNPPTGVTLWAAFMAPGPGGFPVLAAVPPAFYASAGVAGVAAGLAIRAAGARGERERADAPADGPEEGDESERTRPV